MKIKFTLLFTLIAIVMQSQSICDDAYIINTLPYVATNINTQDADSDTIGNYCNAVGTSGNDTIFTYTPVNNETVNIVLSNVQIQYYFLPELFLYDDCPDTPGATCVASAINGVYELNDIDLIAGNTYYIIVTNVIYSGINSFVFDIDIRKKYQNDLALLYFIQPHSDCLLGTGLNEVIVQIENVGTDTAFGFKLVYKLNNTIYSYYHNNDTLIPGQQKSIFHYPDLSTEDSYLVKAYIWDTPDMNQENDTLKVLSHKLSEITSYPYLEDFEDTSLWVSEWARYFNDYPFWSEEQTSWQWGEPNALIIDTAATGTKAMVTNLTGDCYRNDMSYLISPCFDLSSLSIPVFEFDMWKNLDSTASVHLEYTFTDGGVWHRVGTVGTGENWYNEYLEQNNNTWLGNTNGWVKASHRIPELGGEPHVYFRFAFENRSYNTVEGFAIDNIRIFEAPNHDVGISDIISPTSSCNLANDSIKVVIKNYSPDSSHTGFDVKYTVNNGTEVTESFNGIVQANDSVIYTFNTTYDFSNSSEYKIIARTALTNDDDTINDIDSIKIISYNNFNSFPYINDFETEDGSFFSSGINTSWQWGEPTDSIINNAFSGTKIWVTNLSGYHNLPENSYLTSSCFSISNLKRPYIKFQTWYDLYLFDGTTSSYVQLETSIDNGETWSVLGTSADSNWYNVGSSWTGKTSGWTQMIRLLSDVDITSDIQFRFKLWAIESKTGFAIDDFEICDAPISGFTYLASGGEVLFNDTSENAESYEWVFSDGQTSNLQNPTIIFTQDTVDVTLIVSNNCFTDTTTQTIYTVGVDDLSNLNIKIYPNPIKDYIIIENNEFYTLNIELLNITGKVMKQIQLHNKYIKINTSNLENGVYFIRLNTQNSSFVKKVVKTSM